MNRFLTLFFLPSLPVIKKFKYSEMFSRLKAKIQNEILTVTGQDPLILEYDLSKTRMTKQLDNDYCPVFVIPKSEDKFLNLAIEIDGIEFKTSQASGRAVATQLYPTMPGIAMVLRGVAWHSVA